MPNEQKVIRKLKAILSADVKGYSLLMADDEAFTIQTLKEYRDIMSTYIEQHNGRVVDAPGDNLLAEFSSAVDAVQCAVEIQKILKDKNDSLPNGKRLEFRIGVNIGDVVQDGDRIYGSGINVAARIEGLSDPGGVCISRNAYDHIKDKLKLGYEYLGQHEVKNIKDPVRVYKVLLDPIDAGKLIGERPERAKKKWVLPFVIVTAIIVTSIVWHFYQSIMKPGIEPASIENMALPLPDLPSIAVLPFDNMSGNSEYDSLAEAVSESIIYALSYLPGMFVIARNSTFAYKGKPVEIRQVAEELGVRYVLEGSVLREKERVRVTAQLIDATTGYHIWSGRFDRTLNDFFNLLDDITKTIAIELRVQVSDKIAQLSHKTENFDAWAATMRAYSLFTRGGGKNVAEARGLAEKAVTLDPKYGFGWAVLAVIHTLEVLYGISQSPADSIKLAAEYNERALTLDPELSCATANRGQIYLLQGKIEEAITLGEKAIAMGPSLDTNYLIMGIIMDFVGRFEDAIEFFKKAMRLNPFYSVSWLRYYGMSCLMAGREEEALTAFKELLRGAKRGEYLPLFPHLALCAVYAELGKEEETKEQVAELLKIDPNFSLKSAGKAYRWKDPQHTERWLSALRKAGLPETPSLPLPDKPSIAVLAFDNLSGDSSQEFFSDGISEEIINALSKTDKLFVIARNSSFTYKGKPVNVKQVARELGVRYVLEGSVRKSEDRIRITAQLIDATSGHHLWSERYDRELKDIFALQDEITMKIIAALQVELTDGEQMRMWAKRYKRLDVLLKAMELISVSQKGTEESIVRWGQVAQETVDMAPELSIGYRNLGWYHIFLAGWGKSPQENLKKAYEFALKAISLDEYDGSSYGLLGSVYLQMMQHEKAIAEGKRAVELDPNGADVHMNLGIALSYAGRPDEAIEYLKKAYRLNPFPSYWIPQMMGQCYLLERQYEKALPENKKALQLAPKSAILHVQLAMNYILLGREEEARASAEKALELVPYFSVSLYAKTTPFKNQADLEFMLDAIRKAGFPEGS